LKVDLKTNKIVTREGQPGALPDWGARLELFKVQTIQGRLDGGFQMLDIQFDFWRSKMIPVFYIRTVAHEQNEISLHGFWS